MFYNVLCHFVAVTSGNATTLELAGPEPKTALYTKSVAVKDKSLDHAPRQLLRD